MIGHGMHGDTGIFPIGSDDPWSAGGRSHELKFLVDAETARRIAAWAEDRLSSDDERGSARREKCAAADGSACAVTTLCFDTARLDVLHRSRGFRRRKYRIRRSGTSARVALEQKTRRGDETRRRSVLVAESELPLLAETASPGSWAGRWFHLRLLERGLRPTCLVEYRRTTFAGAGREGRWRLMLDRDIRCRRTDDLVLAFGGADTSGPPLEAVLELHFSDGLPRSFKELVLAWRLRPARFSKYRLCMAALGADGSGLEAHVA